MKMKETVHSEDLIQDALAGDAIAMQALLHSNRARLLEYVQRHLPQQVRSFLEPEDVLQDTFIEAIRRLKEFSPTSTEHVTRWLMTIARHKMIDLYRAHQAAKRGGARKVDAEQQSDGGVIALLETLAIYHRTPSRSAAAHELAAALDRSINRLPPDYRQAIRLRHVEGIAAKDAASRMNRTEGAFHLLCNRGLKQLRATMRSESLYV